MNIEIEKAKNDLLTCATLLSTKIRSSDGHGEALKEIVRHYLAQDNVDFAADLADTIEDSFVRDSLLIEIASKCALLKDDEYALQIGEAVEDFGQQILAKEKIIAIKAEQKDFAKAFEITGKLNDQSNAFYAIAIHQDLSEALQTIDKIEFPLTKVHALVAHKQLDEAAKIAEEITFDEEKVRAYFEIVANFIDEKRNDRAIEVLAKAQTVCEAIEGAHREHNLAQISLLYFRAGSVDLADRTLDLLTDKYQIASCLLGFSNEYFTKGELSDAQEALVESHTILKSQTDKEVRNSQARFELFASIAIRFAILEKPETAIEIASEINDEDSRNFALGKISQTCVANGKLELSRQAFNLITSESEKTFTLINSCDVFEKAEKQEEASKYLNEAKVLAETIPQLSVKIDSLQMLSRRYFKFQNIQTSRELATESLENVSLILDESQKTIIMANLANLFDELSFELNQVEKDILASMIRKLGF